MKFSKGKYRVFHLGQSTLGAAVLAEHRMAEEQHCRKLADKPNISQTLCRGQQRKDKRQKMQNGKF